MVMVESAVYNISLKSPIDFQLSWLTNCTVAVLQLPGFHEFWFLFWIYSCFLGVRVNQCSESKDSCPCLCVYINTCLCPHLCLFTFPPVYLLLFLWTFCYLGFVFCLPLHTAFGSSLHLLAKMNHTIFILRLSDWWSCHLCLNNEPCFKEWEIVHFKKKSEHWTSSAVLYSRLRKLGYKLITVLLLSLCFLTYIFRFLILLSICVIWVSRWPTLCGTVHRFSCLLIPHWNADEGKMTDMNSKRDVLIETGIPREYQKRLSQRKAAEITLRFYFSLLLIQEFNYWLKKWWNKSLIYNIECWQQLVWLVAI